MATTTLHRILAPSIPALCAAAGLGLAAPEVQAYQFDTNEASFDAAYRVSKIALIGAVRDVSGAPIQGATVTAVAWGDSITNDGRVTTTDANGNFTFGSIYRQSVLLRVQRAGYYPELVPVDLQRPAAEKTVSAGAVVLTMKKPGRARFLFGGDSMFGRRFVDADEDGIEGEDGDLIQPSTREEDARALLVYLRDVIAAVDYAQVNLESVATDDPATPHPYKTFTFFSYPETIRSLMYAGVDGVSLGNNHLYDYLENGVADTLTAVPNAGLDWFGAGMNETVARGAVLYRTVGGGVDVAFQGFDQIVNDGTTLLQYRLVADDAPDQKAGALELSTTNLTDFVSVESVDRLAIPVLHGGTEYSDYPTSGMRYRFLQSVQGGAGIVIAHHPHTVHGVGVVQTLDGPRYVLMSLGNLIFDQDVFETFQSYVALVDVDQVQPGTYDVHRVQLVPYHIEGYAPKLVAGRWLGRAGRHVGHLSSTLPLSPSPGEPADGLTGAIVFPAGPRIAVAAEPAQVATADAAEALALPLVAGATGAVAFPRAGAEDTLAHLQTSVPASCDWGREMAIYGDFEDLDVDDAFHEGFFWDQSAVRYVENSVVRSGIGAAVFLRTNASTAPASMWMKHRVRFTPGNKLTLEGYVKGNQAGIFQVEVFWYTAAGAAVSNSFVYTRSAGTYAWERFAVDLVPPATAASFRAYFRAGVPTTQGEAETFLDDVSLIEWQGTAADASSGVSLPTPNDWSHVRCTAAGQTGLGLTLTHRTYALAPATP